MAITSAEAATAHTQSRMESNAGSSGNRTETAMMKLSSCSGRDAPLGTPMIDLSNRGIHRLLYALLDEICDTARATYRGRMSARLLGRALALRIGLPVWECQRVAKAWKRQRLPVGARRSWPRLEDPRRSLRPWTTGQVLRGSRRAAV